MSTNEIAIKLENVSKCFQIYDKPHHRLMQGLFRGKRQYFKEFWALKDISFEIKKGEAVGIIGCNGSGKSTLLQIICGTLSSTTGSVEVNGRVAALLELGAGFNPEFTGRENVYMNATILGLTQTEIEARFDEIVAFADIGEFIEQPVKTYSSGMYVRLAFAIQANIDPDILIVDEALAVGDAFFVHRCMLRFHELRAGGCTIVFVSHDASSVKQLCQRVLWLDQGKKIAFEEPNSVVESYLQKLFNIPTKSTHLSVALPNTDQSSHTQEQDLSDETSIPNIDSRIGDNALEILGAQIYKAEGIIANSVYWNEKPLQLRVTLRNNSLLAGARITAGYIFRDQRGIDLASTNSEIEGIQLIASNQGVPVTINFFIELPMLQPGSYSITPSVGYMGDGNQVIIADRISNALIFEVVSDKVIFTPLRFPTKIVAQACILK